MHPFLIITIICSFIFLLYYVLIYIRTKVPITITPKKYYKELFDNFEIKPGLVIYELGSGRGDFLFAVEKFKPKKIIGFELSFLHVLYSKIRAKLKKSKAKVFYKDFFKVDFSDVDIVYLFLVKPVVAKVWQKIKKEAKPGTIVIVLADKINGEKYFQKIPTRKNNVNTSYYRLYKV